MATVGAQQSKQQTDQKGQTTRISQQPRRIQVDPKIKRVQTSDIKQSIQNTYPNYKLIEMNERYVLTSPEEKYVRERDNRTKKIRNGLQFQYDSFIPHEVHVGKDGSVIKEIKRATYKSDAYSWGYKQNVYNNTITDYEKGTHKVQGVRDVGSRGRGTLRTTVDITPKQQRFKQIRQQEEPKISKKFNIRRLSSRAYIKEPIKREPKYTYFTYKGKTYPILQGKWTPTTYRQDKTKYEKDFEQYAKELQKYQSYKQHEKLQSKQIRTPTKGDKLARTRKSRKTIVGITPDRSYLYNIQSKNQKGGIAGFLKLMPFVDLVAKDFYKEYKSEVEKAGGTKEYWKKVGQVPLNFATDYFKGLSETQKKSAMTILQGVTLPMIELTMKNQYEEYLKSMKKGHELGIIPIEATMTPQEYFKTSKMKPEEKTFWITNTILQAGAYGMSNFPGITKTIFRGWTAKEVSDVLEKPTPEETGQALSMIAPEILFATGLPQGTARDYYYIRTLKRLKSSGASQKTITEFKGEWQRAFKELPRKLPITKEPTVAHIKAAAERLSKEEIKHIDSLGAKYGIKTIGTTVIPPQSKLKRPTDANKIKQIEKTLSELGYSKADIKKAIESRQGWTGDKDVQVAPKEYTQEVYNYLKKRGHKVNFETGSFHGTTKYFVNFGYKNGKPIEFINAGTSASYYYGQIQPTLGILQTKFVWSKTPKGEYIAPLTDQMRVKIWKGYVEGKRAKDVIDVKAMKKATDNIPELKTPMSKVMTNLLKDKRGELKPSISLKSFRQTLNNMLKSKEITNSQYNSLYLSSKYASIPYAAGYLPPDTYIYPEYMKNLKNVYTTPKETPYTPTYTKTPYSPPYPTPPKAPPYPTITEPKTQTYTSYNKYSGYSGIPKQQRFTPIITKKKLTTKKTTTKKKPLKDKKIAAYQPIYYTADGQLQYGEPYATHDDAVRAAMKNTDDTQYNKFNIRGITTTETDIRKAPDYRKTYKFRKQGKAYVEKRYYRFDTKRERQSKFNIMPYVFTNKIPQ